MEKKIQSVKICPQNNYCPSSATVYIGDTKIENIKHLELNIEPGKIPEILIGINLTDFSFDADAMVGLFPEMEQLMKALDAWERCKQKNGESPLKER